MATAYHNLSSYNPETVPNGEDMKIGIVVSEFQNSFRTNLLPQAENCPRICFYTKLCLRFSENRADCRRVHKME